MIVLFKRVLLVAVMILMAACATNQFSGSQTLVQGTSLKGSRLYIYSFLDVRDVEFGPDMLTEFDTQIVKELEKLGLAAKVLRFKRSEPGRYFSTGNAGVRVPVGETIASNLEKERQLGADYRLVIFPSKMTLSGAWKFYDVKWELFDAKTSKLVWSATSQGKHLNAWKNDEDPQPRAKTIVDGILVELKNSNLL